MKWFHEIFPKTKYFHENDPFEENLPPELYDTSTDQPMHGERTLIICALQKNLDIENLNTFFKKSKSNFSFVQSNHSFIILNVHLNPTIVLCITCINAILTDFLPIDLNEWARLLRRAFYLITIWRGGATLETLEVLNEEMEGRESESRKEIQLKNSRPYRTRFVTKFSKIPLSTWVNLTKYLLFPWFYYSLTEIIFSWNQLFSNLFCKTVAFTKFFSKKFEREFL